MHIEQQANQLESTTDTLSRFDRVDQNLHQLRQGLAEVRHQGIRNGDTIDGLNDARLERVETEISTLCEGMNARFDAVDRRFDELGQRLNNN